MNEIKKQAIGEFKVKVMMETTGMQEKKQC